MSDTPRTDAVPESADIGDWREHACVLERENNALRRQLAETEGRLEALRESRRPVVEVKP